MQSQLQRATPMSCWGLLRHNAGANILIAGAMSHACALTPSHLVGPSHGHQMQSGSAAAARGQLLTGAARVSVLPAQHRTWHA